MRPTGETSQNDSWQAGLDARLVERLTRRLTRPGTFEFALGKEILARIDSMTPYLPLLETYQQQWAEALEMRAEQLAIVQAQPVTSNSKGMAE